MTPLLLAVPFLLAAPIPKEFRKPTTDLAALQGEWECLERRNYGQPPTKSGVHYVVTGNTLQILGNAGDRPREVKLTLDEKAKTFTWEASWGTWHGRYKLDGDTLTRASVKKDKPLPDDLAPGKTVEYSVYKRAKR